TLTLEQFGTVRGMAERGLPPTGAATPILVARLDWLWSRLTGTPVAIDGIKIDVQGMKLHVLRGMSSLLGTYRPALVVEFHAGVSRADVLDTLKHAGYTKPGAPVESREPDGHPEYADNCSYAFFPDA